MFDLRRELSEKDKKIIENYVSLYGIEDSFIGVDSYLKNWGTEKIKLYKLLGSQFVYKFPIKIEKDKKTISSKIFALLKSPFVDSFRTKMADMTLNGFEKNIVFYNAVCSILTYDSIMDNKIKNPIKIKKDDESKLLQIQAGCRPIKAIQKIIDYFGLNFKDESGWDSFKDFQNRHSLIFNESYICGNLCLSILPIDFMTLSDNDCGWSSCMSWTDKGCYRIGTVEMMNSNNVICCYLESKKPYLFTEEDIKPEERELWSCSNKKWRQLFYVTKDIAVGGKAYSYQNKELTILALDKIKELSEKNLGRSYKFGPELYQDMKHIGSNYRMNLTKMRIAKKDTFKHNIIFDTKGMYNDFFNDHSNNGTKYWCYRNKTNKTKVVSVSGKNNCLCCGEDVITEDVENMECNYDGSYNERFVNVGNLICYDCIRHRECDNCGNRTGYKTTKYIPEMEKILCKECVDKTVRYCPCCGKVFNIYAENGDIRNKIYICKDLNKITVSDLYNTISGDNEKLSCVLVCSDCKKSICETDVNSYTVRDDEPYYPWINNSVYKFNFIKSDKIEQYLKYTYKYLKPYIIN